MACGFLGLFHSLCFTTAVNTRKIAAGLAELGLIYNDNNEIVIKDKPLTKIEFCALV